jgi:hypothetical protein
MSESTNVKDIISDKDFVKLLTGIIGEYVLEECKHLREHSFGEGRQEALSLLIPYMKSLNIPAETVARKLRMTDDEYVKYLEKE